MSDMDARPGRPGHRRPWGTVPPDVDLAGSGPAVAAEVWRRRPGPAGAAGRAAAALARPGPGAGDHAVAAARRGSSPPWWCWSPGRPPPSRPGRRTWRWSRPRSRRRVSPTPTGRASTRPGSCRSSMAVSDRMVLLVRALAVFGAERGAGAGRLGRVGGRGRGHVRLAGPDDRGLRAGAGGRDGGPVGDVGVAAGLAGWVITVLSGAGRQRPVHRGGHRLRPGPALPGLRRLLRRDRAVRDPDPERNVMNVELTDLTRRFGRTQAVAGVNLEAGPGCSGCSGPNGAGKTSLLRMMATVIPPTSGRLRLLGRDPGQLRPAAGDPAPARLPAAESRLLPGLHGRGVRRVLRAAQGHAAGQVPRAVAAAIEHVGLGDKARAKLRTLSGGMLRRAGIAQAIVNEPELLLLDEPTAGLDPEQRVAFRGPAARPRPAGHRDRQHPPGRGRRRRLHRGGADGRREDRLPRHPGRADRPGRGTAARRGRAAGARLQRGAGGGAVGDAARS